MKRALLPALGLAAAHAVIVLGLAVPAEQGRQQLPRAWAQAAPANRWTRLHGRYLTLNLTAVTDQDVAPRLDVLNQRTVSRPVPVALEARGGRLLAHKAAVSRVELVLAEPREESPPMITPRVECFLPEATADPMPILKRGDLWVEVSVPATGPPRPLRLGVMTDGRILPLATTRRIDD